MKIIKENKKTGEREVVCEESPRGYKQMEAWRQKLRALQISEQPGEMYYAE